MRINPIYSLKINYYKTQPKKAVSNEKTVTNPLVGKEVFLNNINFKSVKPVGEVDIYEKGYKDIVLDANGVIENKSRFLVINKLEDLQAISKTPKALDRYYILNNDIDLEGVDFEPIGSFYGEEFSGAFDGNGHTIKNLTINQGSGIGLFGTVHGGKIHNLNLENVNIKGDNLVGGLVGFAKGAIIKNCSVEGNIQGNFCVGGLIGNSEYSLIKEVKFNGTLSNKKEPEIFDIFEIQKEKTKENDYIGGILGASDSCYIEAVYAKAKIFSEKTAGGIAGYYKGYISRESGDITNACFEGEIASPYLSGGIVGEAENMMARACVCLDKQVLGKSTDCKTKDCITNFRQIKKKNNFEYWSGDEYWHLQPGMMPRLKIAKLDENPAKIFLEDINYARDLGKFPYSGIKYSAEPFVEFPLTIKPPQVYKENEELVKKIRESKDSEWLFETFAEYADSGWSGYNCLTTPQNDEILLALVQNKYLPINRRYEEISNNCCQCTPLYVASKFEKPYIFAEMLKRDDVDLEVASGRGYDVYVFDAMQKSCDDLAAYVLFTSKNPKVIKNVQKWLDEKYRNYAYQDSRIINIFNKTYPNLPEYDNKKGVLKIPREMFPDLTGGEVESYDPNNWRMHTFDDVMRNLDVDKNFKDSNGNNLINIAVELEDELAAYTLFRKAIVNETDHNNKNLKGFTPIKKLLETGKHQAILAELIDKVPNIYETNKYGENAIHIFSNNPNETKGILYIAKAIKQGMSVNLVDNFGITALMNATTNRYYNMFNYLILSGADVNIVDNNGQSVLHQACMNCTEIEDLKYIYTLLNQNANMNLVDKFGCKPFDYLEEKMKSVVNMSLSEIEAWCEETGQVMGDVKPVEFNAHKVFLEDSGIVSSATDSFKIEKQTKSVPRNFNYEAFIGMSEDNAEQREIQEMLISCLNHIGLAERDSFMRLRVEILHKLATINHPISKECIERFCKLYPDKINVPDSFGDTALLLSAETYAFAKNDFEKLCCINNIITLIDNGADVNILNSYKQNIMHSICKTDCLILLSKLLEANVNINQKDIIDRTPIEYLSKEITNKMRNYFENYARNKGITLGIENILKGLR